MKKPALFLLWILVTPFAQCWEYDIDTTGAHAFITFKIPHLGYSMLLGQFEQFSGNFTYDEDNLTKSAVSVTIAMNSLDSNHPERDKHLKGDDYLNVEKYPKATFNSTQVKDLGEGRFQIIGELNLHGVSKEIVIDAHKIGQGPDPWGGYRAGFSGTTTLKLQDFGIPFKQLGPASSEVSLELFVEGIRKINWKKWQHKP